MEPCPLPLTIFGTASYLAPTVECPLISLSAKQLRIIKLFIEHVAHPPPTQPRATTSCLAHHPARVSNASGGGAVPQNVVARGGVGWCGALVGARCGNPHRGRPQGLTQVGFFEHGDKCPNGDIGDIGDIGDNGDKSRSTREPCLGNGYPPHPTSLRPTYTMTSFRKPTPEKATRGPAPTDG